jgi:NAD(P)-dependent dehydrogenase (short-subunit alcohol dehydrogenase family)
MAGKLEGLACVVIGTGQGMGRESAREMARQGGKVVVADINEVTSQETVALIAEEGGIAISI